MAKVKTREDYRRYERTVELFRSEFKLSHLSTREKTYFSGDRCDCCQDEDGGDRYDLYAHQEGNAEIVTFSICVDCVYYSKLLPLRRSDNDELELSSGRYGKRWAAMVAV